ncbi:hypothetical protein BDQ12DRAFT_710376 [Crucibulum laeve]|uniref:Uncharacterized protein n=1 Tax=Crucibulum laeve TaxID=68775 RepID=A0A5C3M9H6_9AGAR|nr:hypothetical protein BDQ12DRAFT_710376 [Crucibulum laeve]
MATTPNPHIQTLGMNSTASLSLSTYDTVRHSILKLLTTSAMIAVTAVFFFVLARIFGHVLRISTIRLFSIQGLSYTSPKTTSISINCIKFTPHLPRPSAPHFGTLYVENFEYKDPNVHYSCGTLEVALWFFPVVFRRSNEPIAFSKVDDFRLRVFKSASEPWWIARLRNNVVSTFLNGETTRLHDLKTRIYFNSLTGITGTKGDSLTGEVEKPGLKPGEEQDEARVKASIEEWQICNLQEQMYTFGKLDVEVRRSWVEERGTMVMIAENCRLNKLPSFTQRQATWWQRNMIWEFIHGIVTFPHLLFKIVRNPLFATDLHILRTDITYDEFRLRDAEMFKQSAMMARRQYITHKDDGMYREVGWDTFMGMVLAICFPNRKTEDEGERKEEFVERVQQTERDIESADPEVQVERMERDEKKFEEEFTASQAPAATPIN